MSLASEERLFVRFCRTGDPAALAEVFDRLAPELLRVATHLVGQHAVAEDVVQETFLAAIEHRQSYDPARALRPWLVTILTNKARRMRRDEQRPLDPSRAAGEVVADPEQQAQSAEVARTVDATIGLLPEVYHPVLQLHLRQGLLAVQIAASLRRPAGTVRSQLTRGLELLRRALPASLALGAAAVLTPERGLAAVRARVLAQATALHGGAAATTASSSLLVALMTAHLKLLSCAAALALGATLWAVLGAPAGPALPTSVPAPPPTAAAAEPASRPADGPMAAPFRAPLALPETLPAGRTELVAQVVFADGSAAAGITVLVSPADAPNPVLLTSEVVADAEGEARFVELAPGRYRVLADRGATAEATLAAHQTTHARLTLARGLSVRGRVTSFGLPVVQAEVWLSRVGDQNEGSVVARTGAEGTFHVEGVPSGSFLSAWSTELPPCANQQVKGSPGDHVELELVLAGPADTVSGRVVDSEGSPVAGARLALGYHRGPDTLIGGVSLTGAPPRTARSGVDGTFRIHGVPRVEAPLYARAPGFVVCKHTVPVATGTAREVEVRLERGFAVRGRVLDAAGAPLAGVFVRMGTRPGWWPGPGFVESWVQNAADGSFLLDGLPPGSVGVMADGQQRGSTRTTVTGTAGGEVAWDPVLGAGPRIAGRVVDERGQPLAGFRVGPAMPRGSGAYRSATTDAEGRFAVADCQPGEQRLLVHDPQDWIRHPVVVVETVVPGGDPLTVTVPDARRATGRLRGRLAGEQGQPLPGVRIGIHDVAGSGIREIETDAEGVFQTGLLHPARYRVRATRAGHPQRELGDHDVGVRQELDLGTVRWELAGGLQVTARWEDGAPAGGTLLVSPADAARPARFGGSMTPLPTGSGQATGLPPGDYLVKLSIPDAVLHEQRCTVRAGQDTPVTLTLRRGTLRWLRLLDAQGQPLASMVALHFMFRDPMGQIGGEEHAKFPTHELQRVLPAGDGRLLVETASGQRAEVAITDSAGTERTAPLVVTLK